MNRAVRKRKSFTLEKKIEIINSSEDAKNKSDLAGLFDLNRETVRDILRNKESIMKAAEEGMNLQRAKLRKAANGEIKEAVLNWAKRMRSQNLPITGDLMKVSSKKHKTFGSLMGGLKFFSDAHDSFSKKR